MGGLAIKTIGKLHQTPRRKTLNLLSEIEGLLDKIGGLDDPEPECEHDHTEVIDWGVYNKNHPTIGEIEEGIRQYKKLIEL